MASADQLDGCPRLFIKTLMGNAIPIAWLFIFQPFVGLQFDGVAFWTTYAVFSMLVSLLMWVTERTQPDPLHLAEGEIPTPIRGRVAVLFQPTIYLGTLAAYSLTR